MSRLQAKIIFFVVRVVRLFTQTTRMWIVHVVRTAENAPAGASEKEVGIRSETSSGSTTVIAGVREREVHRTVGGNVGSRGTTGKGASAFEDQGLHVQVLRANTLMPLAIGLPLAHAGVAQAQNYRPKASVLEFDKILHRGC